MANAGVLGWLACAALLAIQRPGAGPTQPGAANNASFACLVCAIDLAGEVCHFYTLSITVLAVNNTKPVTATTKAGTSVNHARKTNAKAILGLLQGKSQGNV